MVNITITILDIIHLPVFLFKTQLFGEWILSPFWGGEECFVAHLSWPYSYCYSHCFAKMRDTLYATDAHGKEPSVYYSAMFLEYLWKSSEIFSQSSWCSWWGQSKRLSNASQMRYRLSQLEAMIEQEPWLQLRDTAAEILGVRRTVYIVAVYNSHNSGNYSSPCLLIKNRRFGYLILSSSSGGT
jgi:hypothetical protein